MRLNIGLTLLLLGLAFGSLADKSGDLVRYKGKVTCEGKGVAGVVVTDGLSVCVTDKMGKYALAGSSTSDFVYISSPAGYQVPVQNSVPQFFHRVCEEKTNSIDFQLVKQPFDDTNHGFVVWADPQVKSNEEAWQARQVAEELSLWLERYDDIPFHGQGCGDIVGDNPALYDSIKNMLAPLNIPFYQAIGNHDLSYNGRSNEASSDVYESHFGPAYYSFNRGDIHYVVLNDVFYIGRDYFYIGYLQERQLAWLEQDLAQVDRGSTVVVTTHIPTALSEQDIDQFAYSTISQSLANKHALYQLLEPYQTHIISGHMHVSNNVLISPTLFEHNISSVCGAWWQGPYAEDGTPKGYAVFEARGSDLIWYFKSFGYDKDYQFRAYGVGSNPEQPEYLTVNVWNWDPRWKVYWYENGKRMGEMERYSGVDPETANVYSDKQKLNYKWITARKSNHMFRAKPEIATSEFAIEVIDRFGKNYKLDLD
ncbi:calcineurin-like phosphoesterase family protein [uncultured Sunxiuqinia sp.]|uniref:calcineurin-like phosphoesterase family protein n=1 Tax=uncultured Sunxiuqinia sp. TaxID=1573825 RepID=UPI0030DC5EFC|tara:strand:+ start:5210 stop:6649 length:1440 start_codon:yes stop_codon:yes gene_type:complete